jgi:dihydroxyacetone kinase-like protein
MSAVRGTLKKLTNEPSAVVDEMLDGFLASHPEIVSRISARVIGRTEPSVIANVGVAIGGGSGHEPAFLGYVGYGMADTAPIGNIVTSPSSDFIYQSIVSANHGRAVVLLYGNYSGDVTSPPL